MRTQPNRATRRRLAREVIRRIEKIEAEAARVELIQIHTEADADLCYLGTLENGNDFVLRVSPDGLTYGEREEDGFCSFEVYGSDGGHLYGFGGDGYDLEKVALNGTVA